MKKKVILSFIVFIVIVVSNQIIFHFDLKRQYYDVEIINKAGKQRMFSQKLTKLALYAKTTEDKSNYSIIMDEFSDVLEDFSGGNYYINHIDLDFYKNSNLEELHRTNQQHFNKIEEASTILIDNINNEQLFKNSLAIIKNNEAGFLISMDKIVEGFQKASEKKIRNFEKMQLLFNAATLLLLFYVLFAIIIPLFGRTPKSDEDLE
tara:strand:+ start:1397 stop:2014 length:618 start_codon:yes stop_codon:yes gene_type:complete